MEEVEEVILAVSSSYDRKYFFNQEFDALPREVKEDIQVMLVMFTMEIGGILTLFYTEKGALCFRTECDEEDVLYDEIGADLKVKELLVSKRELLESLEAFFKVFYLDEPIE